MSQIINFWISFLAGLSAPLVAVCVIPLYPGFLAYLSSQLDGKESRKTIAFLGIVVSSGVIISMLIIGLIFSLILKSSLTNAIGIISPIAFVILAIISIMMIIDFDIGRFLPKISSPVIENPLRSSFVFGLFFGAIVLPCNPAPLFVLFAVSSSTVNFISNLLNFIFFGLGMSLPLLLLAFVSYQWSGRVVGFLTRNKTIINRVSGVIMLGVSVYYLFFVFRIQEIFA